MSITCAVISKDVTRATSCFISFILSFTITSFSSETLIAVTLHNESLVVLIVGHTYDTILYARKE